MNDDLLFGTSQWVIYPAIILLLIGLAEFGYRIALWRRRSAGEVDVSPLLTIQGALFGFLALLIGFTFAMALARFDQRQDVVLGEANAIATVALRAQLLPSPHDVATLRLLDRYATTRLEFGDAMADPEHFRQVAAESARLQAALWAEAVAVSAADPKSTPVGLFVESVNQVIDFHEDRVVADGSHVPTPVFYFLYAVSGVALAFTGYGFGAVATRHRVISTVMAVLVASVVLLIMDLDRPRRGLIRSNLAPLVDSAAIVRQGLASAGASAAPPAR